MKIIVCLDKNDGMLFNKRRQSRDSKVIEDIMRYIKDETLYIEEYSKELFEMNIDSVQINDRLLTVAKQDNFCFIEKSQLSTENVEELIIYRWNKVYPADKKFSYNYSNMTLKGKLEFEGTSHDKIIREVYVR